MLNKAICKLCWNQKAGQLSLDARFMGWRDDWDADDSTWQCWHTNVRMDFRHPCLNEMQDIPIDCIFAAEHVVCQDEQ
jgi:hypothetical protein